MSVDPLFVRLYLDEDVVPDLADAVRRQGFDCQSAAEAGMLGKSDEEQLEWAASQGRCILSFNVPDFADLARQWSQAGKSHAGIAVMKQVGRKAFGRLLGLVLRWLNATTADEMRDSFRHL